MRYHLQPSLFQSASLGISRNTFPRVKRPFPAFFFSNHRCASLSVIWCKKIRRVNLERPQPIPVSCSRRCTLLVHSCDCPGVPSEKSRSRSYPLVCFPKLPLFTVIDSFFSCVCLARISMLPFLLVRLPDILEYWCALAGTEGISGNVQKELSELLKWFCRLTELYCYKHLGVEASRAICAKLRISQVFS
jgi:hypothetical protein